MMKRVISLVLCALMLVSVLAGCAGKNANDGDNGAYISMYLTEQVYDLDPARAYNNESALRLVSLVFDNLFVLDENGKVKKSLAKDYEIFEDDNSGEYEMIITLKDGAMWTDGTAVTANDVYYAWTRILKSDSNFDSAALLYDIKNARAAKEGDVSIDDVAISALNEKQVRIMFEEPIDYDQFILNLTSYALVPLREDIVGKTDDWAKKPATICSSGPFRLREVSYAEGEEKLILERNPYYYRDVTEDAIDKSVTPYRITVDYTLTDEEIMAKYEGGEIFFVGDIPMSVRADYKETAEITDALSTHTYFLNENAVIRKYSAADFESLSSTKDLVKWKESIKIVDPAEAKETEEDAEEQPAEVVGDKIFADSKVREAMSMAIDRDAIAEAVVFARAATALVPYGIYDSTSKKDLFREVGGDVLKSAADLDGAKALLAEAGVDATQYMFAISVAAYDDVHMAIAEMVKEAWTELGFHVQIKAVGTIKNVDWFKQTDSVSADICDDLFMEAFAAGLFEVAAVDYVAKSVDAFSVLAPFAKRFTGGTASYVDGEFAIPTHITGYDNEEYNQLIEDALAEKDIKARAELLHQAEQLLLEDMPVIPIIFNQNAYLVSDELSKIDVTYYGTFIFTKTKLKDYELYIPKEDEE